MAISDRLQVINNALVGGNVISILARQAIRIRSLQSAFQFQVRRDQLAQQVPVYNPPSVFIAGIPVSVRKQETYMYQADVTEHAVESGSILSDHVILHPIKIDLSFETTNWESGRAELTLNLLEELWQTRTQLDLLTEHKKIEQMVLTSFSADNSVPNWGALGFRATFKQVKLLTLESVKYPAQKVDHQDGTGGPDTSKSAETSKDQGQQKPKVSNLKRLFS